MAPPLKLSSDDCFKRAYMYYEKNENARALSIIDKSDQNEVRFMELKAQLLYRLGKYEECLKMFNEILGKHSDEFDDLRRANVIAVHALLEAEKRREDDSIDATSELPFEAETFEQIYNAACFQSGQGNYGEAIKLLDRAIEEARVTLTNDGLEENEIQEELSVILTQKAYALERLGSVQESLKLYTSIQDNNTGDKNTKAVFLNNLLAIEKVPSDLNKLKVARRSLKNISEKGSWKLIPSQKRIIISNLEVLQSKALLGAASAVVGKEDVFQEISAGIGKRNRKRKPRLPKNYDPNVAPDPERWLPRQERSSYKKKLNRKYKDRDIGRGTQGSASAAAAIVSNSNIDFSKGTSSVEQSPKPTEGPRQQRPGAPKKAKKKKGGGSRW